MAYATGRGCIGPSGHASYYAGERRHFAGMINNVEHHGPGGPRQVRADGTAERACYYKSEEADGTAERACYFACLPPYFVENEYIVLVR